MRRWIFAAVVLSSINSWADRTGLTDPIGGSRAEASGEALPKLPPWLPAPKPSEMATRVGAVDDATCEVYVERQGIKYRVGHLPASLLRGDVVQCMGTQATQELRIGLRSGSQIRLNKDTQIKIKKYQHEEREAQIDLSKGSLSLLVRPGDNIELNTPSGNMGSQEGEFEVLAATPQIDGLVRTIHGSVWVRGQHKGQAVGAEQTVPEWSMVRVTQAGTVSGVMRYGH